MASYTPIPKVESNESSLLETPETMEEAKAVPMVHVTAPANLPEGYEFVAVVGDGKKIQVKVPMGGVEQGQVFPVPYVPEAKQEYALPLVHIPVGHWRDGLLGLFNYGMCHPHMWTACLCPLLAAGQVIRRLHFTWRGTPAQNVNESTRAFLVIFYITMFHWFMIVVLYLVVLFLDPNDRSQEKPLGGWEEPSGALLVILLLFDFFKYLYWIITAWILYTVRKSIRAKYAIPDVERAEDCLCSCCCSPCVAGQMLRHTTDYDIYPSNILSTTGLPKTAPEIV